MNDPIVVTRSLVKRAWSDIEPKLIWALITGQAASIVINLVTQYGVKLTDWQQNEITLALAAIGGWIAPSVGTTVTKVRDAASQRLIESEAHSGPVVSTITNSIPIQTPSPAAAVNAGTDSVTRILNGEPDATETAVISPGKRFFEALHNTAPAADEPTDKRQY